jgi:hypothetical protein
MRSNSEPRDPEFVIPDLDATDEIPNLETTPTETTLDGR